MRLETTISERYLAGNKGWNPWAGIREIVQNGRDAEIQYDAPLNVRFRPETSTLVVENEGCTIPRSAMLLGATSKSDDRRLAGIHGDGLKAGCLVLVRAGAEIKIRTGGEVWTAGINSSDKFGGERVLTFDVETGRQDRNRVQIEIKGINKETWDLVKGRFLFLEAREVKKISTVAGELLLSPRHKGQVYVKGIFVQQREGLQYGYNFLNMELDRDRRVLDSYDVDASIRNIWTLAVASDPTLSGDLYGLLASGAEDVRGLDNGWYADQLPEAFKQDAAARFVQKYGAEAIPVETLADSKDVEHLGVRGIVTPKGLGAVIATVVGDVEKVKKEKSNEVLRAYGWHELEAQEQDELVDGLSLIERSKTVEGDLLAVVDVVDFRSAKLFGQFKDGRVLVAKRLLADRRELLATLVHEFAHRAGGDGDKGHGMEEERIFGGIVDFLRGK
jgi:hypothetical protein